MMLFRVSLIPALVCAGVHISSEGPLSSVAEVAGIHPEANDSQPLGSQGQEIDIEVPAAPPATTAKLSGERPKVKLELKKLSQLPSARDGHAFSLRGPAAAKAAEVAVPSTPSQTEEEKMSSPLGNEAVAKEQRPKGAVPALGSHLPLSLSVPAVLKSRTVPAAQKREDLPKTLKPSEPEKDVAPIADDAAPAPSAAPTVKEIPASDDAKSTKPKITTDRFHARERTMHKLGDRNAHAPAAGDTEKDCSGGPSVNIRTSRGQGVGEFQCGATPGIKRRKPTCGGDGAPACTEGVDQTLKNHRETVKYFSGAKEKRDCTGGHDAASADGKLRNCVPIARSGAKPEAARHRPVLPHQLAPPQPVVEERKISNSSECALARASDTAKPQCTQAHHELAAKVEMPRMASHTTGCKQAHHKELATKGEMPKLTSHLKPRQEALRGCQQSCPCELNKEKSGKLGTPLLKHRQNGGAVCGGQPPCLCEPSGAQPSAHNADSSADPSNCGKCRKLSTDNLQGRDDKNTPAEALDLSKEQPDIGRLAGQALQHRDERTAFALEASQSSGEQPDTHSTESPAEPSNCVQCRRLASEEHLAADEDTTSLDASYHEPTSGPAASPTQHYIHKSSPVYPTPLSQLEELFLNVGGHFADSPLRTALLREGLHLYNPPAGDDALHSAAQ